MQSRTFNIRPEDVAAFTIEVVTGKFMLHGVVWVGDCTCGNTIVGPGGEGRVCECGATIEMKMIGTPAELNAFVTEEMMGARCGALN